MYGVRSKLPLNPHQQNVKLKVSTPKGEQSLYRSILTPMRLARCPMKIPLRRHSGPRLAASRPTIWSTRYHIRYGVLYEYVGVVPIPSKTWACLNTKMTVGFKRSDDNCGAEYIATYCMCMQCSCIRSTYSVQYGRTTRR